MRTSKGNRCHMLKVGRDGDWDLRAAAADEDAGIVGSQDAGIVGSKRPRGRVQEAAGSGPRGRGGVQEAAGSGGPVRGSAIPALFHYSHVEYGPINISIDNQATIKALQNDQDST